MSVITISRQLGSLGTEIAQGVAGRLRYEYVDKERIAKALVDYGVPAPEVEKFDERKPPFWDSWQVERKKFIHSLQGVIFDFARKGNVVLVGRGGQILLKNLPGIFHLRVVAPFDFRLRQLLQEVKGDEKQAERVLRRSDRDSAGFIQSFFDVNWDAPELYDLVINTQKVRLETAISMILLAVQTPEIREGEKETSEKLGTLALLQRVEAAIMGVLGIDIRHINIQVDGGAVTLRGAVGSVKDKENCERAVAAIPGVCKVDNQLLGTVYHRFGT